MLKFERRQYERLLNYTVSEVDEDSEGFPLLVLRSINDSRPTLYVSVSQDPEGNGPGHLFIEEVQS